MKTPRGEKYSNVCTSECAERFLELPLTLKVDFKKNIRATQLKTYLLSASDAEHIKESSRLFNSPRSLVPRKSDSRTLSNLFGSVAWKIPSATKHITIFFPKGENAVLKSVCYWDAKLTWAYSTLHWSEISYMSVSTSLSNTFILCPPSWTRWSSITCLKMLEKGESWAVVLPSLSF